MSSDTYDEYGYIAARPVTRDRWPAVMPDQPPGRFAVDGGIPPGMLVIQNFLDPQWCAAVLRQCAAAPGVPHAVGDGGEGSDLHIARDVRNSEHVDVRSFDIDIVGAVERIFTGFVAPHYGVRIEWFERPGVLRYREGGTYVPHADSENWIADERRWKRVIDRDLSILLYLNSDFEGGKVTFSNFGFDLQPSPGMLVAFPSDHRYMHAVQAVTAGVRYAIVSWAAVVGTPRLEGGHRPEVVVVESGERA